MLHILRRYIATLDTCRRCRAGEVCTTSASAQHTKHRDCNHQSYFHVLPLVGWWNSAWAVGFESLSAVEVISNLRSRRHAPLRLSPDTLPRSTPRPSVAWHRAAISLCAGWPSVDGVIKA